MNAKRHRIAPSKVEQARRLRRDASFPERLLWSRLRASKLGGLKFRRQHVVGPFVVDFYCAASNLAIELDGRSHDERIEYDRRRTEYLNQAGIQVVRYANDDVLEDVDAVAEDIARRAGGRGEDG